ncbi:MAG: DUF4112 domain-containing protein [Thiogranum sp.]|nr:DUF4112 domain-containing protein [Thiogranum sp.]
MPARDTGAERNRQRATLQRLAHVMDSAIPLPGGLRIGMDGIIGLIPGVGDAIGAAVSSYIVIQANSLGVSRAVLMRMFGNILIDAALGAVPVVGDLFDFAWKANRRNIALLEGALAEPRKTRRRSALVVAVLVIGVLALAVLVTAAAVALVRWIWTSLGG